MEVIPALELQEWMAYEFVHGSLSVGVRIDQSAALIAERVTNMLKSEGKAAKFEEFTPRYGRQEVTENGSHQEPID